MEKSKAPVFAMSIIAIIVGAALYREIDFKTMTVEKPALCIIYAVTFLGAVVILVKNFLKRTEK